MQILSAYLFEAPRLRPEDVIASADAIAATLANWMIEKGASNPDLESGSFVSKTKGFPPGSYHRRVVASSLGTLQELVLQEPTNSGQIFITTISVIALNNRVVVYATLAVKNAAAMVAPVFTDPRCPSVVKRLIDMRTDWEFGGYPVPRTIAVPLSGTEGGMNLVSMLQDPARTLPVVVVSEVEGEPIWERLEDVLAADLAGLACVVRIDEEASWTLTDELGKLNSCYLGAVRLYWPMAKGSDEADVPRSSVWTASYMLSQDSDGKGMQRIRAMIRRSVMTVASLTIEPPAAAREIQNEASRSRFRELEQRANSNSEELELARLFIEENEELKTALDEARREVARQASKAETAEYALSRIKAQGLATEPESVDLSESGAPEPGEIRYYKKTRNAPSHDVLVRIQDCGHNAWQAANKADKAKKGVEKLEGGSAWANFYHCAKCAGGGVWKVEW